MITEIEESSGSKEDEIDLDPRLPETEKKMEPVEDTISIVVDDNDNTRVLHIGSKLGTPLREQLIMFLKKNLDMFAWSHADMVGIDPEVM